MLKPKLIKLRIFNDERGSFKKLFDIKLSKLINVKFNISQINISYNIKKGTVRGMHGSMQKLNEAKLIYCLSGKLFDVVINYNKSSSLYLKKFYFELDSDKEKILYVPPGYLHGFQSLKNNTSIIYLHNTDYYPKKDIGLNPLNSKIDINWPVKVSKISYKDLSLPGLGVNK